MKERLSITLDGLGGQLEYFPRDQRGEGVFSSLHTQFLPGPPGPESGGMQDTKYQAGRTVRQAEAQFNTENYLPVLMGHKVTTIDLIGLYYIKRWLRQESCLLSWAAR